MAKDKNRDNRSQKYQNLFHESSYSNEMMQSFSNDDSISNKLNPYQYNEELLDLEDQLKIEFWRIVEMLTPRQKEVIKLYADGYTQMEIAKILKVNQSSIVKCLQGNRSYGKKIITYGGSRKKLKKIISEDSVIQSILKKMAELRELKW